MSKVLRVFWIHHTYAGKSKFKKERRFTDFDVNTPPESAKERILAEFGKLPSVSLTTSLTGNFAEVVTHTITEASPPPIAKAGNQTAFGNGPVFVRCRDLGKHLQGAIA